MSQLKHLHKIVVAEAMLFFFLVFAVVVVSCSSEKNASKDKQNIQEVKIGLLQLENLVEKEFALEDSGDFPGAIEINKQILKIVPNDPRALNSIAGLYGKLGVFEEEIKWAQEAIRSDVKFYMAYINLGNAQASLNQTIEAKANFEAAKALAPRSPLPLYSLGTLAESLQDMKGAVENYERALEIDPSHENSLFALAAMYANLKLYFKASVLLKRLLILNPKADDARQMLESIESDMKSKRKSTNS